MAREARKKSQSGIYHIMWRGANRQEIFHDEEDCMQFLDYVETYKRKAEMQVFAWCLMNNHVHLLIKEGNQSISDIMKCIGVCYVGYYNWKYRTIGPLFQDRFKSEIVESVRYLFTVVRYIHQNPVKAGMVKHVTDWKWSSCRGFYDLSLYPRALLDSDFVLNKISSEWLKAKQLFIEFNERTNQDDCLDDHEKKRITDDEARKKIAQCLATLTTTIDIAQVKSLPRDQRTEILRQVKQLRGVSQRQAARVLGVSPSLVFRA